MNENNILLLHDKTIKLMTKVTNPLKICINYVKVCNLIVPVTQHKM